VGHAPTRSFGAVFRYPTLLGHSQPGRSGGSLSLSRSAALVGFVLTRLHLRRVDPAWRVEPAFPPFRAHVPFAPPRPPRLIFVGVTRPFARGRSETLASVPRRAKDGSGLWWRSTSGLRSRLRSGPPMRSGPFTERRVDGPILPWLFVLFQGCRARFSRATAWARPRADHQPPAGSRRTHNLAAGQPIRSWAWDASSPIVQSPAERPPAAIECVTRPAGRLRVVLPFSVFEGLMPGRPSRGLRTRVGRLPV
jgi:hypothetical protein